MEVDLAHHPLLPPATSSSPSEHLVPKVSSARLSIRTIFQVRKVLQLAAVKTREWLLLLCLPASILAYLYSGYLVILAPGRVYKTLMDPDWVQFRSEIRFFLLILLLTTSLRVLRALLRDATANLLRARLGTAIHARYLSSNTSAYFACRTPDIDNVDQRAAADIASFSESLLTLFSGESAIATGGIVEACASLAWYTITVGTRAGFRGILIAYIWSLSASFFALLAVNIAAPQQYRSEAAEADLRYAHAQTRDDVEEIAFSTGHHFERIALDNALFVAVRARWAVVRANIVLNFVNHGFAYCVSLVMYAAIALAVLAQIPVTADRITFDKLQPGAKAEWIAQTGGVFIQLLYAFTMLVGLGSPLSAFVSHTHRIHALLHALEGNRMAVKEGHASEDDAAKRGTTTAVELRDLQVALPDGRVTAALSLRVAAGERVLLAGPSGVGKTTVLRALRGLALPCNGDFTLPSDAEFLPQRTRIPAGVHRLRTVVLYPALEEGDAMEIANIRAALHAVGWPREDNVDDFADWATILSPGERQRVAIAGLLVRRPRFCILDEPTSSLDSTAELRCFDALREHGIALLTVAHREALHALHDRVVYL